MFSRLLATRKSVIEDRIGDIFEQRHDLSIIVHQTNLYHIFGSGIASEIKKRYPYAYAADCKTTKGDRDKLGSFTLGYDVKLMGPDIINLYSQDGISATHRTTHYAAMGKALFDLERWICDNRHPDDQTVGIPHGIGCGLAGGDWNVVRPIIESAFGNSAIKAVICRLPSKKKEFVKNYLYPCPHHCQHDDTSWCVDADLIIRDRDYP